MTEAGPAFPERVTVTGPAAVDPLARKTSSRSMPWALRTEPTRWKDSPLPRTATGSERYACVATATSTVSAAPGCQLGRVSDGPVVVAERV